MTIEIYPLHNVTYDGANVQIYHAQKGQGLPRHSHAYAHLTMCHAGSCAIRKEGIQVVIDKDSKPVNLLPDGWHEIEALEDGTVFVNVFSEGKL
jgi:quercetin dioxygenase-like cupin family protein